MCGFADIPLRGEMLLSLCHWGEDRPTAAALLTKVSDRSPGTFAAQNATRAWQVTQALEGIACLKGATPPELAEAAAGDVAVVDTVPEAIAQTKLQGPAADDPARVSGKRRKRESE